MVIKKNKFFKKGMSTDENDFEHTTNIVENLDVVTPNMFDRCFYPSDTTLSQTLDSFFRVCRKNGIVCEPSKKTKYDFKKREKPVFIQVRRIIDTKHKYLDSDVLFVFKDTVLFPDVNPNTNNYWTWCAMKLKKILKEQPYSLKGLVRYFVTYKLNKC